MTTTRDKTLTMHDIWFKFHHDKAEAIEKALRTERNPARRINLQAELEYHRLAMRRLIQEAQR